MPSTGHTRRYLLATAAVCAVALSACSPAVGPDATPFDDPFATRPPRWQSTDTQASGSVISGLVLARGSGDLRVAYPVGHPLPATFVSAFEQASGYTVVPVPVHSPSEAAGHADVLIGMDDSDVKAAEAASLLSGLPPEKIEKDPDFPASSTALAYGRDDVCAVADLSWFSANKTPLPTSLADLATPEFGKLLAIPHGQGSTEGRAFAQLLSATPPADVNGMLTGFIHAGATVVSADSDGLVDKWTAGPYVRAHDQRWAYVAAPHNEDETGETVQSAAPSHSGTSATPDQITAPAQDARPIIVGTQSLLTRAGDTTGGQSPAAIVSGTCVRRTMWAGTLRDSAQKAGGDTFLDALQQDAGQHLIAESGWLAPLAGTFPETPSAWFLGPDSKAVTLEAGAHDPQSVKKILDTWGAIPLQ